VLPRTTLTTLVDVLRRDYDNIAHNKEAVYHIFQSFTYRADGDPMPYDPTINRAQDEFHTAAREGKRYLSIFGGSGLGKSMSAAREASIRAFKPGATIWLLGATYPLAHKEFEYCFHDLVEDPKIFGGKRGGVIDRAVNNPQGGDMHIKFAWGAEIKGVSAKDADRGSLLGEGLDCLVLCEGAKIPEKVYEHYLERAISRRLGTVICNTTPAGKNWVWRTFAVPFLEGQDIYWSGFDYPATVNPFYDKDEFERQRERYGEDNPYFQEQFMGKFVAYTGMCYPEFRRFETEKAAAHVMEFDPAELPKEWPRTVVIDPHLSKAHAIGFYATDFDSCPVIVDEAQAMGDMFNVADVICTKYENHGLDPIYYLTTKGSCIIDTFAKVPSSLRTRTPMLQELREGFEKRLGPRGREIRIRLCEKPPILDRVLYLKRMLNTFVPILAQPGKERPWLTVGAHCTQHIFELGHAEFDDNGQRRDENDDFINCFEYYLAAGLSSEPGADEIWRPTRQGRLVAR